MREIKIHGIYRHYKGNLYIVEDIIFHSETGEKMVAYRALYDDHKLWCRPYDMFLEEIDHEKYPEIQQKYRFEFIDIKNVVETEEWIKNSFFFYTIIST